MIDRHLAAGVLIALIAIARPTLAQHAAADSAASLAPGTRIRVFISPSAAPPLPAKPPYRDARGVVVHEDPRLIVGNLVGLDTSRLRMTTGGVRGRAPFAIPLGDIARVQQSTQRRSYTAPGVFIGLVGGFALGYASASGCPADPASFCLDFREAYGAIGAVVGGVIGGVAGRSMSKEKWADVSIPPVPHD